MFTIDMKKGFQVSFVINIVLAVLLIVMTILYFIKGNNNEIENPGLQTMIIEEGEINFDPNRYAYLIEVDSSVENLNIIVVPYEKDASVSLKGNENLKEGYNQVIVTVSDSSSKPKYYYIDVIKSEENIESDNTGVLE